MNAPRPPAPPPRPPRPPSADKLGRGALLALVVHGLLIVALALGVAWRSSEPAGVEAELWAAVPQAAAPRAEPAPPAPPPEPPKPRVEAPPPPAPDRDAEIALDKAKREKELLEKKEREEEAKRKKAEQDKRDKEAAEKKKAEEARKKKEEEQAKRREAEEAAQAEDQRKKNLERMMGQVGATGAPGSTGTAQQSAGPSAGYAGRLKARIKPNIVYPDDPQGNPTASVEVRAAPDGTILSRRLVKSSGLKEWDDAVLRAIDRTEVLPRDVDGRVPSPIVIDFRPRE
jgi:colicin import membrane protein